MKKKSASLAFFRHDKTVASPRITNVSISRNVIWRCPSIHDYDTLTISLLFRLVAAEKRPLEDTGSVTDSKRRKVDGDIMMNVVTEIVETITEPDRMLGPHVSITATTGRQMAIRAGSYDTDPQIFLNVLEVEHFI